MFLVNDLSHQQPAGIPLHRIDAARIILSFHLNFLSFYLCVSFDAPRHFKS